jgi:CRISPR-associated protein Csb2
MLAIEVTLLTGRYVATTYNDRRRAEWPPHPARLFSALAATHFGDETPEPSERLVLEWLERLGPPEITASGASEREVVTVFVPVNDTSVVKSFDEDFEDLDNDRQALEATQAKLTLASAAEKKSLERDLKALEKSIAKSKDKLEKAVARELAAPSNPAKAAIIGAEKALPDGRGRQPRTFPSVTPLIPKVVFSWPAATPTSDQSQRLDALLARLVRLGHSSSLVSARVLNEVDEAPSPTLVPSSQGPRLRTPRPGQLATLEANFALHRETEPRVMPAQFQPYAPPSAPPPPVLATSCFSSEWLVFRRTDGPALPITAGPLVARTFRRALMSQFGDCPIPELLSGHRDDGSPSATDHLALLPLPFVGHRHADGNLLGLALVLPRSIDADARRILFAAVARWEQSARHTPQNADLADGEVPLLPLHLGPAGVLHLERVEGTPKLTNLRPETWCHPTTHWLSVTPIALDRNPGDLHSRDPQKLARAHAEARETLTRACLRVGLPAPAAIEILPAAPWAGSAKTRQYGTFTAGQTARVLTHARLVFDAPVEGPVILGAGRYAGLGLFRPEPPHE